MNIRGIKEQAKKEVAIVKSYWKEDIPPLICDIGANIGIYSVEFLKTFPESVVHAYEPNPDPYKSLSEIKNDRLVLHPYGLYMVSKTVILGLPSHKLNNIGCYSVHFKNKPVTTEFKKANNEEVRPDIVKLDVEGSEVAVLSQDEFMSKVQILHIELVCDDRFKQNLKIKEVLHNSGFIFKKAVTKNNQIWVREL